MLQRTGTAVVTRRPRHEAGHRHGSAAIHSTLAVPKEPAAVLVGGPSKRNSTLDGWERIRTAIPRVEIEVHEFAGKAVEEASILRRVQGW